MPKTYGKTQQLHYKRTTPIRKTRLKQMATQKTPDTKVTDTASVANVMDVTYFLSRYLSGSQDVAVSPDSGGGYSVGPDNMRRGGGYKQIYRIHVPDWRSYQIPVQGFNRYRIYRSGLWHETQHVKHTPPEVFRILPNIPPVEKHFLNIVEDRRIEELGVKDWPGYLPERLYTQAYAYALRPDVTGMYQAAEPASSYANQNARVEAFLQRMLIGKVKGSLPQSEMQLVELVSKETETKIKTLNSRLEKLTPHSLTQEIVDIYRNAQRKLQIDPKMQNRSQQQGQSQSQQSAEQPSEPEYIETFTTDYAQKSEDRQEKEEMNKQKPGQAPQPPKDPMEEVEKQMHDFFKEKKANAQHQERDDKNQVPPEEATQTDVDQAEKGSASVQNEYSKIQKKLPMDPSIGPEIIPVATQAPAEDFRDQNFITKMNTELRVWKTGYKTVVGASGARLSIPHYIRFKEEPFATRLKQSVRGRKVLVIADFSSSISGQDAEYKRAIVSGLEVLDGIGSKTALFGFGRDPIQGVTFFSVKRFEEQKWTRTHANKLAAVEPGGSTPTAEIYTELRNYIRKQRPYITITLTDGGPDDTEATVNAVRELKKHTRMVAIGIAGSNPKYKNDMEQMLKTFKYHDSFAVGDIQEIPPRLVKTIIR
jgi:hypothetical protein